MTAITIRLPNELAYRLEMLANLTGRTKTFYVTKAIEEHLQDIEDLYIAEQRLVELRAGRSRTYTTEEVERELPDFLGRLKEIYGDKRLKVTGAEIVSEDRDE